MDQLAGNMEAVKQDGFPVDTQLNTTGAALHVYERVGGLKYSEVEVGQETVIFDSESSHHSGDGETETQ